MSTASKKPFAPPTTHTHGGLKVESSKGEARKKPMILEEKRGKKEKATAWWEGMAPPAAEVIQHGVSADTWAYPRMLFRALQGRHTLYKGSTNGHVGDKGREIAASIERLQPGFAIEMKVQPKGDGSNSTTYVWDEGYLDLSHWAMDDEVSVTICCTDRALVQKILRQISNNVLPRKSLGRVYVIGSGAMGPQFFNLGVASVKLERGNYSSSTLTAYDHVVTDLGSVSPCGRLAIFDGPPGTGKCVAAGTQIVDAATGVPRPVEEIVARESNVLTFRDGYGIVSTRPSHWIHTGQKECLEVVTSAGHSLVVTPEHPLMTVDGWKPAGEIEVGSFVAAARKVPVAEDTAKIPRDHIVLLAALLADGGYTHDHVSFTKSDDGIVALVKDALSCVDGELRQYDCHEDYEYRVISEKVGRKSKIRLFLDSYGIDHEGSRDKKIPEVIYRLGEDDVADFIGVLWSCDGSIDNRGCIELGMASEVIVRGVQHLLLRLGIVSNVKLKRGKHNGMEYLSWRCTIVGTSRKDFCSLVPLVGRLVARSQGLTFYENPNDDLVPLTDALRGKLRDCFDEALEEKGRDRIRTAFRWSKEKGPCFSDIVRPERAHVSRARLTQLQKVSGDILFDRLLGLRWEKVMSISLVGEREVYDLTVPDGHCFIANDLLAHNTFLIRAILNAVEDAMFVLVPPEMMGMLASPQLIPMLLRKKSGGGGGGPIIFILEDADNLLTPRDSKNLSLISSLLNFSSGMLGSMLDIRAIATTNSEKKDIDAALMRPGRLCRQVTVGALSSNQALSVVRRLLGSDSAKLPDDLEDKNGISLAQAYRIARDGGWKPTGEVGDSERKRRYGDHSSDTESSPEMAEGTEIVNSREFGEDFVIHRVTTELDLLS